MNLAQAQRDSEKSIALILEGLALYREVDDKAGIASAFNYLGEPARNRNDYQAARTFYQNSVIIQRELGNKRRVAVALLNLGFVAMRQGEFREGASFCAFRPIVNARFGAS
jgi:hypothetical protein